MTGFFDSGVGGLAILKAFLENNIDNEILFFAINGGGMIGSKSHESIMDTTQFAIEYLASQECHKIYLACNTASANTLIDINYTNWKKENYSNIEVLDVINPTLNFLKTLPKNKRITILATPSTINSNIYIDELTKSGFSNVAGLPTVMLARSVEDLDYQKAKIVLKDLFLQNYDRVKETEILVLSCTHYIWIKKTINEIFENVFDHEPEIISQGKVCFPGKIRNLDRLYIFEDNKSISLRNKDVNIKIVTTDGEPLEFAKKAQKLLNQ